MTRARDNATQGGLVLLNTTTASAASVVSVNNVFTSDYRNYLIQFNLTGASTSGSLTLQLSSGGNVSATTYYAGVVGINNQGSASNYSGGSFSNIFLSNYQSTNTVHAINLQVFNPQVTGNTTFISQSGYDTGTVFVGQTGAMGHYTSASYDGFKLTGSAGTFSGILRIYGYKN